MPRMLCLVMVVDRVPLPATIVAEFTVDRLLVSVNHVVHGEVLGRLEALVAVRPGAPVWADVAVIMNLILMFLGLRLCLEGLVAQGALELPGGGVASQVLVQRGVVLKFLEAVGERTL